jgi:tRNA(Glu) U13 pseudouridine synthase TruD
MNYYKVKYNLPDAVWKEMITDGIIPCAKVNEGAMMFAIITLKKQGVPQPKALKEIAKLFKVSYELVRLANTKILLDSRNPLTDSQINGCLGK